MENVLPRYQRPIASTNDPINKVEHWNNAINAFDDKEFKKTAIEIINYMNPNMLEGKDIEKDIEIVQMQGSAELHVKITDTQFSVKAPFLKITDKTNKVPLLRKVAEVNFSPLKLAQIQLENDELWFKYEMPIELCQPNKVYDILRSIAVYSDDYDDIFISKYKASFYKEAEHTKLSEEERKTIWKQISTIFEDYTNYTQFFKDKRWDDYQWDNLVISMLKVSNMPYVHGKLRSDLIEYIGNLFDGDLDYNFRVDKGVNFMKKLLSKSKDEIMKDVYHAEQFISLRWRSSEQIITDRLKNNIERVQEYEKKESYFNLSYYLQFTFLKLIYDYNLEANYKEAIETVLEEVSGLEPSDAAPKLAKVFYALQDGSVNNKVEVKEKKGFFSKLFK
ncbi:MAG TPA: hypothetical protein EYG92_06340 [Lutibacter sp.]|nr:hypothetical protein [Lutibacter sp.]